MRLTTLLPLILLLASACSIEDKIERREDRLIGSWQIERATFKEDDNLFRDNVTSEFRGDRITFYADYSLVYVTGDGQFYDGAWRVSALRELDDDLEFTLDADFYDGRNRLSRQWLGLIDKLTDQNFNINLSERNGTLRLRWDRF